MTKEEIIFEIKRTAKENQGKPLGYKKFGKVTGISIHAWRGKYWRNWGDALKESGFEKNKADEAYDNDYIIRNIVLLTRKNERFPTYADALLEKNSNFSFPGYHAIKRLGNKNKLIELVRGYVTINDEYSDILKWLPDPETTDYDDNQNNAEFEKTDGFVYLVKEQYSKHYKIGKTFDVPRRHREIALELPGHLKKIHAIRTDDPSGIEAYWHNRFASKRTKGEWFALNSDDIRVFKKRKFM